VKLTPTPEQQSAIEVIASDKSTGAIVGAEIGAGKTLITVEAGLERFATRWLIVAPLAVFENWRDTVAGQTNGLGSVRACGKKKYAGVPTKELVANLEDFMSGKPGFYFMGREFWIAQDWHTVEVAGRKKRQQKHAYKKAGVDVLVFDEAHFGSSRTSKGYKTFMYHPAEYKMAVTGTFFGNDFANAWTLPNAIWGKQVTDTFALWRARYASTEYSHFTYDKLAVTGEKEPGEWVKTLPNYIYLPGHKGEVITEEHFVDLHPSQRKMYDGLDENYAAKALSGEWLLADLAVTARTRMRQAALADIDVREKFIRKDGLLVAKDDVFFPLDGKSAKYDEFLRLLRDHDEQVVATLDFAKAGPTFVHWLKRDGISAALWAGAQLTPDEERMQAKASFLAGDTRVLIGVPAAMGTGVDGLQKVCRRMNILSETQNGVERQQLIGRLDRKGQERPVYVVNIHARDTIDVDITNSLALKAIENEMIRVDNRRLSDLDWQSNEREESS
jgi:superfamily II DNA or RNA helicase